MKAWVIRRRQDVLTGDDVTEPQIRARIGELDTEQRIHELGQPDVFAIVVADDLHIVEIGDIAEMVHSTAPRPPAVATPEPVSPIDDNAPAAQEVQEIQEAVQTYACELCPDVAPFSTPQGLGAHRRYEHPADRKGQPRVHRRPVSPIRRESRASLGKNDSVLDRCPHCQEKMGTSERIVIANIYEAGVWVGLERYHPRCYTDAGEPYGEPTSSPSVNKIRRVRCVTCKMPIETTSRNRLYCSEECRVAAKELQA